MTAGRSGRDRPRRLLLLIHFLSLTGMEQQLMHLARGLAARGDDVTVACAEPYVPLELLTDHGVDVVKIDEPPGAAGRLRAARHAARLARSFDLVHCTGWDASLWGRVGGLLARKPIVVTEHALARGEQVSRSGRPRGRAIAMHNRLLGPLTYATIAVAERQDELLRSEGVPASRIVHIPNGIPLGAIREIAASGVGRADLGVPEQARLIVQVGRLEPLKRQRWTLEAAATLRERGEDVHVLLVGDGSEREALAAEIHERGWAPWAHLAGIRADVPRLIALSDLAVLPSSTEALPMAMIEAMAVGVPLVTTDVGDMGRVLRDSGAGLAVAVDDHDGFVRACEELLHDRARAASLAECGRAAAGAFDSAAMVARYSAVFDAALDGLPPEEAQRVAYAVSPWPSGATG